MGTGPQKVENVAHQWTRLGLLVEGECDGSRHRGRHAVSAAVDRDRRVLQVLREDRVARRALEGRSPAQQLVQDEPVRVDIGLLGDRALLDLFGRQILSLRVCVDEALDLASVADTRQLDVQQLDVAILEHHHVARTDGAVDESHVVQGLDGSAELEGQSQRRVDPERRSAGHQLIESAALDELRDGEEPAHVELAELEDSSHRGMRGRGTGDRAAHPQHGLRSLRRVREAAREETDRDSMAG